MTRWGRGNRAAGSASRALAAAVVCLLPVACDRDSPSAGTAGTTAGAGSEAPVGSEQTYRARLRPLAGSGVAGEAGLSLAGSTLTVRLAARGLEPREEHVQHIHRLASGAPGRCPTRRADPGGDGRMSLREALPAYGRVALPLEPFPRADGGGRVRFRGTFELPPDLDPIPGQVVALYGRDVHGVYDPTVPVACGRIG